MSEPQRKLTRNEKLIREARSFRASSTGKYTDLQLADALEKADAQIDDLKISLDAMEPIVRHEVYEEILEAREEGLLGQWLEFHRPKTMEEWEAYEAAYPRGTFFWDKKDKTND